MAKEKLVERCKTFVRNICEHPGEPCEPNCRYWKNGSCDHPLHPANSEEVYQEGEKELVGGNYE